MHMKQKDKVKNIQMNARDRMFLFKHIFFATYIFSAMTTGYNSPASISRVMKGLLIFCHL